MIKMTMTIAALLVAAPVMAQEAPKLWGNISAGMTEAEVKALYPHPKWGPLGGDKPTFDTKIADGCTASVEPKYDRVNKQSVVRKVKLSGYKCGDTIRDALHAKYGDPMTTDENVKAETRLQQRLGTGTTEFIERWVKDGVEVKLVLRPSEKDWEVHYLPAATVNSAAL